MILAKTQTKHIMFLKILSIIVKTKLPGEQDVPPKQH